VAGGPAGKSMIIEGHCLPQLVACNFGSAQPHYSRLMLYCSFFYDGEGTALFNGTFYCAEKNFLSLDDSSFLSLVAQLRGCRPGQKSRKVIGKQMWTTFQWMKLTKPTSLIDYSFDFTDTQCTCLSAHS
jgi:hypothetical protein